MNIAIIPARYGSKRIPQKNIKPFLGSPMISYPIETVKKSKFIDEVFVSTDHQNIANIAENYGALVPFLREDKLSDDLTPTAPVISNFIKKLLEKGFSIDNVCCVYPCTPLLNEKMIDKSYAIFKKKNYDFIYPVIKYRHPIQRAMRKLKSGKMEFVNPKNELVRTQDLEDTYHDSGQFYWGKVTAWTNGKKMHTDGVGFPVNAWEVIDIDNEEDWQIAKLFKENIQNEFN